MFSKSFLVAAIVALTPAIALAQGTAGKAPTTPTVTTESTAASNTDAKSDAANKPVKVATHKKSKKVAKPATGAVAPSTMPKPETHS